ncbi:unnamed protein product [Schistosoma mattheei]|uniref:Uncharacterized protein n=1 Tax=Schistosoma mattheei TaxID=31246 RepID=A0A183P9V0_9TREM|nr:unnamed protein product [Schistosoma mattheei]
MFKISLISYLLLLFTFLYVETKLSDELRKIYRFHKQVRKDVQNCKIPGQPPAVKLAKMKWNKLLADKAKQQAKRCQYDSNDPNDFIIGDFESIGQNLGDYPTIERAMKDWLEEHKNYDFKTNTCNGDCKNYKQDWVASTPELMIENEVVELVDHFTYLASLINPCSLVCDEISARIPKAQLTFDNLRHLWSRRDIGCY